jgi:hypothetical protein
VGAVLAATAAAATLAFEGADEPADGEESRRRQYKPYYYRLYHLYQEKIPMGYYCCYSALFLLKGNP